ncbi:HU family DNA-binding protein [Prevotella sp. HUN102]|uniref:HU family DNA-binding protein n=1 Tax=Prevotella sp. HUN102 TaxID=1392486 RepID=UPI00048C96E5|nr:HU family DNA-binding protein [Prevotella sp. HUN102]
MNNKEFIAALAAKAGYSQEDTQKLVKTTLAAMADNFEAGEPVQVSGFGTFEVKKRLERVMVNPSTGLRMLVPPKLVLNFKPTASIKEKLKKGGNE